MIPLPTGVSGVACDRHHRHAQGLCEPVAAGAGGSASRSPERPSALLPRSSWQSVESDLARRARRLPVHEAPGTGPLPVAESGRRRGCDLAGAARLSVVRHRLAAPGDVAANVGGMIVLTCFGLFWLVLALMERTDVILSPHDIGD